MAEGSKQTANAIGSKRAVWAGYRSRRTPPAGQYLGHDCARYRADQIVLPSAIATPLREQQAAGAPRGRAQRGYICTPSFGPYAQRPACQRHSTGAFEGFGATAAIGYRGPALHRAGGKRAAPAVLGFPLGIIDAEAQPPMVAGAGVGPAFSRV